jgi:RNA polymerase sigma-70 factor (ECF subfamily)
MLHDKVSDKELVRAYLDGREAALEVLVSRHQQSVFSYLMSKVKDVELANDLFQDVFVKVIKTLKSGKYNEEGKFLPWVLRICHNLVIDTFRREQRERLNNPMVRSGEYDIFERIDAGEEDIYSIEALRNDSAKVKRLIEELPQEQFDVLYRRMYCEMSFKAIAEELDTSINTCLGRMRYALINLRKIIEKRNIHMEVYSN